MMKDLKNEILHDEIIALKISKIKKFKKKKKKINDLIEEFERYLKELEGYLFKKYCMKGYLSECEPEYCSYRITRTCEYIFVIRFIKNELGIDLISI